MNSRHGWLVVLVSLPMTGFSQSPDVASPATPAAAIAPTPRGATDDPELSSPRLDPRDLRVQQILRTVAASQSSAVAAPAGKPGESDAPESLREQLRLPERRSTRQPHYGSCEGSSCVAYSAYDEPLFGYQRNLTGLIFTSDRQFDRWLACQDDDDLLTTFERYERCTDHVHYRDADSAVVKLPRKDP